MPSASGVILGGAVALALYRRPRAWRCLAAFTVVFTVTMLPLALPPHRRARCEHRARDLITSSRCSSYFLVLAALAVSRRLGGRRRRVRPAPARRLRLRPSRRTVAAAAPPQSPSWP